MANITINGAGSSHTQPVVQGNLTIKNADNSYARMSNVRKSETKVKKPLNYNHREISGQLLRAKKAQSAGTVLTRAKARLATLQRAAGSGQYNEKEVANALAHARRMVRCAQLKVRNLKEEEREQNTCQKRSGSEQQKRKNEVKRRAAQKERQLKSKMAMEELQDVQQEKNKRQEMLRKRRSHRNTEQGKIAEADMKYIKGQMENQNETGNSVQTFDSGVFVELSTDAAMLAQAQMSQQTEAEIEAEIEAEMALEMGSGMDMTDAAMGISFAGVGGEMNGTVSGDLASVDISV